MRIAVAQHALNLRRAQRLHNEVADLAIQLPAQNGGIPVEIARELLDSRKMRQDARVIAEE